MGTNGVPQMIYMSTQQQQWGLPGGKFMWQLGATSAYKGNNNNNISDYTALNPTQIFIPQYKSLPLGNRELTGSSMNDTVPDLLHTVDFTQDSIKDWAILYSGSTSNFLVIEAPVADIVPDINPLTVTIPDDAKVQSTHTVN